MHGGGLFISHSACPSVYFGTIQFDILGSRPISRAVEIKANYIQVVHVSGVSICRNATILDLRLATAAVAPVLGSYKG
jgi:hypothetical protein